MPKLRKVVRSILAVFAGVLSIPAIGLGSYFVFCSVRIHTADVFYVDYPYLFAAAVLLGIGAVGAVCSIYGAIRQSFYGLVFVVPIWLGLATMIYIPDGTPHIQRSMTNDSNYLGNTGAFLRVWYEAHRKFPKDKTEFLDAIRTGPAVWEYRVSGFPAQSDYAKRGVRLPYQIVVNNSASGPRLRDLSKEPGVIYYCVTNDQQQFWVTMTGLHEDVSDVASLKTVADLPGEPWIITAQGTDYPLRAN